jgi:hypothetical protein
MKKVAKKTQSKIPPRKEDEHTEEIMHYIGVVSEEFHHRVSGIAEQFDGLNKRLDKHDENFMHIAKTLDDHGARLGSIESTLGEHSRKLDSHAVMMARVMEDVEEIKSGMREKVDRTDFVKLEKRLVVLEAFVYSGKKK